MVDESILLPKVIVLCSLFVSSLIAASLPWYLSAKLKAEFLFSFLNCLSGGVVLGAAFSHMFPDSQEHLAQYFGDGAYPYASLLSVSALLLLWSVEKLLLGGRHSHSEIKSEDAPFVETPSGGVIRRATNSFQQKDRDTEYASLVANAHSHAKSDPYNTNSLSSVTSAYEAYVFLVALSIHSIFEGLGLGAENTEAGLWSVIVAVVSHKTLEAFALGLSIFHAHFPKLRTAILLFGYSLATPLGIGIGMAYDSEDDTINELVIGIMTSLASGSFFYISLIEILPTELDKQNSRKKNCFIINCCIRRMGIYGFYS